MRLTVTRAPLRRRSKWLLVEVVDSGLYVLKNGCLWRDLPGELTNPLFYVPPGGAGSGHRPAPLVCGAGSRSTGSFP